MAENFQRIDVINDELKERLETSLLLDNRAGIIRTDVFFHTGTNHGLRFTVYVKRAPRQPEGLLPVIPPGEVDYMMPCDLLYLRQLGINNKRVRVNFADLELDYGGARGRELPHEATVGGFSTTILYQRNLPIYDVARECVRMPVLIGLLATQRYFREYYADYSILPNEGVEFRPVNQAYLAENRLAENLVEADGRFTRNELDILFGLLVLASTKTISIGGQRDEFIRNRLSAMRYALKAIEFTRPDAVLDIFTMNTINAISSTMALFPRLKVLIFSLVLRHTETPILAHLALSSKGTS